MVLPQELAVSHPLFRHAYVVEPGRWDFSGLENIAARIIYLTTAYEKTFAERRRSIVAALGDFDPSLDVVVPVGKVSSVFLVADLLAHYPKLNVAVYNGQGYEVLDIHHMPETEGEQA
jgi:hypothetical protein